MDHWLKPALRFVRDHHRALTERPVWMLNSGRLGTEEVDAEGADVREGARQREFDELTEQLSPCGERVFFGAFDPSQEPVGVAERVTRAMPAARQAPDR